METGFDQLHGMWRQYLGRLRPLSTLSSPEVVHPQKIFGFPSDRCDFGGADQVCSDVWRSNTKSMVWVSEPIAAQVIPSECLPPSMTRTFAEISAATFEQTLMCSLSNRHLPLNSLRELNLSCFVPCRDPWRFRPSSLTAPFLQYAWRACAIDPWP
jgi:hypothetical protein